LVARDEFDIITAFVRDTNAWTRPRLDGNGACLEACESGKLRIVNGDLNGDISGLCEKVDVVFNFAARTFVDHSIKDPAPFIQANVLGTANMLEEARRQNVRSFFQVSTDEVYGQILEGAHHEDSPICPRNPYAASKAGGDALAISYAHTFDMCTIVTRTENNYGPYQHPQKAMPVFIGKGQQDKKIPVYGDGKHVRQWLHVKDHVDALIRLWTVGVLENKVDPGEVFHVAGNQETTNTGLAKAILDAIGKPHDLIEYIDDFNIRPGHDRRYALTCDKIEKAVGWKPTVGLEEGLAEVVEWYQRHPQWLLGV
jgi:dTDP-glucose 4,6-dehydratase